MSLHSERLPLKDYLVFIQSKGNQVIEQILKEYGNDEIPTDFLIEFANSAGKTLVARIDDSVADVAFSRNTVFNILNNSSNSAAHYAAITDDFAVISYFELMQTTAKCALVADIYGFITLTN